ncbi:MAG: hypothetical protein AB1589_34780, partial [Cyanobacteriota bacterium]
VTTTATGFTDDQAKALFEYIFIYRDDGDGTWTTTDTIIATVTKTAISLSSGSLTIGLTDNDERTWVNAGSTTTFFLVVELTSNAGTQSPRCFVAKINNPGSDIIIDSAKDDIRLDVIPSPGTTSTQVRAVRMPPPPQVDITSTAPAPKMKDGSGGEDILKMKIIHTGDDPLSYSRIELDKVTIKFSSNQGTLTTADAQALFSEIAIYRDVSSPYDIYDTNDYRLQYDTFIGVDNNGEKVFTLSESPYVRIKPGSSATFFITIKLKDNASGLGTETFSAYISTSATKLRIEDINTDNQLSIGTSSSQISATVTAVPVESTVIVENSQPPIKLKDGTKDDLLRIYLHNNGISTAGRVELATLTVHITTSGTTTPMASQTATMLFKNIFVYLDSGDNVYATNTDIIAVGTITNQDLSNASIFTNGTLTIVLPDVGTYTEVSGGATKTYFVVVELNENASRVGPGTESFVATIKTMQDVGVRDESSKLPLDLKSDSSGTVSSSLTTAVPLDPKVEVTDIVPIQNFREGSYMLRDGDENALLRLKVIHTGSSTAGKIELGTLTIWFGSETNTSLTSTQLDKLFEYICIRKDGDGNGTYSASQDGVSVGTMTADLTNGYGTITFTDGDTNAQIPPAVNLGSCTYFLVVKLRGTATANLPKTFVAKIGTQNVGLRDESSNLPLPLTTDSYGSQSTIVYAVPVDPVVIDTNTVSFTYPYQMDGSRTSLLKIEIGNKGTSGAGSIEFATLTVRFSYDGANLLTDAEVRAIFGTVSIWETSSMITEVTGNQIKAQMNIDLPEVAATEISAGATKTYYLQVTLLGTASSKATRTYSATVNPLAGDVRIEDKVHDIKLYLGAGSSGAATSTTMTAIPVEPSGTVTPTSPIQIRDKTQDDLLKLVITNNGISGAGTITLTYLRLRFFATSTLNQQPIPPMSTQTAEALFENIFIYKETVNDGTWTTGDTIVGTISDLSTFLDAQGQGTVTLATSTTWTPAASSTTYFIVVELKGSSSAVATKTFSVLIDSIQDATILDTTRTDIKLNLTPDSSRGTSSKTTAVPTDPKVEVTDIVPYQEFRQGSYMLRDGYENALLRIKIIHTGASTAGSIEFGTLTVWFGSDTTTALAGTRSSELFEYVRIHLDGDNSGTYSATQDQVCIGTIALTLTNGWGTVTFTDAATDTQVSGAGSKTYFLVVKLRGTSTVKLPKTFLAKIETSSVGIRDATSNLSLPLDSASYGSQSTIVYAVPVDPTVKVYNTISASSPYQIDGTFEDLLRIEIKNNGTFAGAIEFATMTVRFTDKDGNPVATSTAKNLFKNIFIYLDNGDGVYSQGSDTVPIGTITNAELSLDAAGYQIINFTDNDLNVTIASSTTWSYFLVIELRGTASGYASRTYSAEVGTANVTIKDAIHNIKLYLDPAASIGAKSGTMTAIPVSATVTVTNIIWRTDPRIPGTVTPPVRMTEGEKDAIFLIEITNNGGSGAGAIEFATLTVWFGSDTTRALMQAEAAAIFGTFNVYLDVDNDGTYSSGIDTVPIGTFTRTEFTADGTMSIRLQDNNPYATVTPGATKKYFLVVELVGTSSSATPNTFVARVDADVNCSIESAYDDILISVGSTEATYSTQVVVTG